MKITRYLWINNLPNNCEENEIRQTFQSHGKIQTIRIHKNNNARGAIVAFIDCKSSTKAYDNVKTLMDMPLKLEYCEASGEPGINLLGNNDSSSDNQKTNEKSNYKSVKTSISSRSRSNSSNTSSFGSSIDDCSKYPGIQTVKRSNETNNNLDSTKSDRSQKLENSSDFVTNDKQCLNKDLCGLLIENLSQRSSDTSLREGLFHEYKKHGKITSVTVMGQASSRYAIISFKRSEDMEKAFEASQGKIFFGSQIKAKQHNGFNYIDPDLCPPEHAMDEYHPKATKTLFVGKLTTGSVTEADLKKSFKKYGEIIDIDIKTQSNQPDTSFAFVQYYDISSVVRALRNQDNIKIDNKSVKLGFGKSQPTNCLWIGNLQRNATDAFLRRHFRRYGPIVLVIPDPEYSCAIVQFDCVEDAQRALADTRDRSNGNNNNSNRKMQVDYASNEYQMAFMNRLRKSCQFDSHDLLKNYADPYQTEKIQNLLISYTKYLGLLEETRPQSYERFDNKSDYEDYDEMYSGRNSRHRKSGGNQRIYGEDDYSDDYRFSKQNSRHYDDYSPPTHSAVRYSRSSQKFTDQYTNNSRKSSNYRYNDEYYDSKHDSISNSNNYYQHRRNSPDPFMYSSNHNRSYSPSPSQSSVEYCVDSSRYNTSSKRYRHTSKDYGSSRCHDDRNQRFDRSPETRSWNKSNRYDYDNYNNNSRYRSKSGSRSRLSGSNSPHSRHSISQHRVYRSDSVVKTSRSRKINNSEKSRLSSVQKNNLKANNNVKLSGTISGSNYSSNNNKLNAKDQSGIGAVDLPSKSLSLSSSSSNTGSVNISTIAGGSTSASQSADTLSKLERERAKLLQELSMLSEEASIVATNNKLMKGSVKPTSNSSGCSSIVVGEIDAKSSSIKSVKKHVSPISSSDTIHSTKRSSNIGNGNVINSDSNKSSMTHTDFKSSKSSCDPEIVVKVEEGIDKNQFAPSVTTIDAVPIKLESRELLSSISSILDDVNQVPTISGNNNSSNNTLALDLFAPESSVALSSSHMSNPQIPLDSSCSTESIGGSGSTSCRDPRLIGSTYSLPRSLSTSSYCSLSSPSIDRNVLCLKQPLTTCTTWIESSASSSSASVSLISNTGASIGINSSISCASYKDCTSDSDLEHFNNIDSELDKRIRELDAKLNRSEQTARTHDYSKFRIRKKICDTIGNCSTVSSSLSSGLISSPTCLSTLSSSSLPMTTTTILDVIGYSSLNRDNTSNTSEFIKTMLNQTKPKNYHLLTDVTPFSDHLATNYSSIISTNPPSLSFGTVDLGANDIERRTLFSRYNSVTSMSLSSLDLKLNVDTTQLSPPISNTYSSKSVSAASSCSISSSKIPNTLTISPTTSVNSTKSTPTIIHEINQPMKSILKKSAPPILTSSSGSVKLSDLSTSVKCKPTQSSQDCNVMGSLVQSGSTNSNSIINAKSQSKKPTSNSMKRKSQSESEDSIEYSKPCKKLKAEYGPVLDTTFFQTYPSTPVKKAKRSTKNLFNSTSSLYSKYENNSNSNQNTSKKISSSSTSSSSTVNIADYSGSSKKIDIEKLGVSKKPGKINQSNHVNLKTSNLYKDNKKSSSKLSINKKVKSKVNIKPVNRKNKPSKAEKVKKSSKRSKDRKFYENLISIDTKEQIEDENNDDLSEFDDDFDKEDSVSSDNGDYESMYDKIKRRNSKKAVLSNKKRRIKKQNSLTNATSSDAVDSEDSEYWISKSNKKCSPIKRKRARMSDLSSSHFSDTNSCKTTPCGKSQEPQFSSDYSDIKSEITNQKVFYNMKVVDDNTKYESVTDESKAPAESFNLSSPHNSSQCSSPKYSKDINLISVNKDVLESTNSINSKTPTSYRTRSQHRPNEGPLKKRPIAEPIVLSEDLPYLEKQPDEEFISTSPTSINEEPPSQLESMYDIPQYQQTNVLEEVVLDDHHHSLDVVEVEYGRLQDTTNDQIQIDMEPLLSADVDSASHILMTMKTQPSIDLEYANINSNTSEPDQQIQSVAEQLINLAKNSVINSVGLPQSESSTVIVTEEERQAELVTSTVCNMANNKQKDYEVTIYVKNIIDKIKKETDLANSLNKEKLVSKRNKKSNPFNMTSISKPLPGSGSSCVGGGISSNQDCRQILPLEINISNSNSSCNNHQNRLVPTTGIITPTTTIASQSVALPVTSTNCVFVTSSQTHDQICQQSQLQKCQLIKPLESKRTVTASEETTSIPSTGRRTRHNSAKSDCQLQSLDETIDNVVKSSMSSSISDAVSNKSTLDGDLNVETETVKSNSMEMNSIVKPGDFSSLEETMNEVIHKMSNSSPTICSNTLQSGICEIDTIKSHITSTNNNTITINNANNNQNNTTNIIHSNNININNNNNNANNSNNNTGSKITIPSQDLNKQKKMNINHVKAPMYQLAGNMGGIANLVLGIPSILTVNTLVNQQNSLGQNKITSQLTLPISKLSVSTIPSNIVSASSLVPSSITLNNQQTSVTSVQSTEVMLTKLNSLTPIMIPTPLRNVPPLGQTKNLSSPSLITNKGLPNPVCGTLISGSNCIVSQDNKPSKLINVSLTASVQKPITSPINVVPRPPITPTPALNLSKLSVTSVDAINNYLLMQRQVSQVKSKLPNLCHHQQQQQQPQQQLQQSTSTDVVASVTQSVPNLTASITNTGHHPIILSQLTHANSVLSPITTAYLTAPINKTNATTNLLHSSLPSTTNGINAGIFNTNAAATAVTPSVILRPVNIPFPKFEEKNDWLKQNTQTTDLNYPIQWTGKLCLKNDEVFVQMHMLAGNKDLIKNSMNLISNGQTFSQPLRIVQRMRLEPNQLEGLQRRLSRQLEFCTCLTLAGGDKSDELARTSSILNDNFIKYLQEKSAAGIINICIPDSQQNVYVIHIFPPCEFSDNQLKICSATLYEKLKKESVPYLLVVITTV